MSKRKRKELRRKFFEFDHESPMKTIIAHGYRRVKKIKREKEREREEIHGPP